MAKRKRTAAQIAAEHRYANKRRLKQLCERRGAVRKHKLIGGPYAGESIYLSLGSKKTLSFSVNGFTGRYVEIPGKMNDKSYFRWKSEP